jgi:hypothetical protein
MRRGLRDVKYPGDIFSSGTSGHKFWKRMLEDKKSFVHLHRDLDLDERQASNLPSSLDDWNMFLQRDCRTPERYNLHYACGN